MMGQTSVILIAFVAGLAFRKFGFPPLLGYLLTGFIAHSLGLGDATTIAQIADIGVLLLLFTIGLKLNIKELIAPQVWAVAGIQMALVVPLTTGVILIAGFLFSGLTIQSTGSAWILAFALSFSSTVFAVKIFDERGESASFHAALAIGILIIQDLIAVVFLVLSAGQKPNIAALALLGLPLLRPLLLIIMKMAGHRELFLLFGFSMALGAAELFELVHLKDGLGALVLGALLSGTAKSNELYKSLIHFKDFFLIGFFIQIGFNGLPSPAMIVVAFALAGLIFLRPIIYFLLFIVFKLRARTALLAALALFNYSEFGLIVATMAATYGVLTTEWVTTIALAMSLSFFIAMPFNTRVHSLYSKLSPWLQKIERKQRLAEERPVELGDAKMVILGMGRVGFGAYQYIHQLFPNDVIGIEDSIEKVKRHQKNGIRCVQGDASDQDFWEQAKLAKRDIILVGLTNHLENIEVVKLLQKMQYQGKIAVVSRFPDEQAELLKLGCITFNLYAEAGHGFAEHVLSQAQQVS